jgi:hypothetical protein
MTALGVRIKAFEPVWVRISLRSAAPPGRVGCLGGFPGFHPGLRNVAPPGHLSTPHELGSGSHVPEGADLLLRRGRSQKCCPSGVPIVPHELGSGSYPRSTRILAPELRAGRVVGRIPGVSPRSQGQCPSGAPFQREVPYIMQNAYGARGLRS